MELNFLIGPQGTEFLSEQLTTHNPVEVITQFQLDNKLNPEVDM